MTDINQTANGPKIVVIGGGTGSFTLLTGLKRYTTNITALVSMVDDGGSTGQLRDEYGVLPPGDVRRCLVALSNSSQELRELFNYRFGEGSLEGHSFGNIFLAAVEKMTSNFADATRLAAEVMNISGNVVPITFDNVQLVLHTGNDEVVGQRMVDSAHIHSHEKPRLSLRPNARINPDAQQAIMEADMVVLAPGSLYGSLIASLIVDGVAESLQKTNARILQVVNLVTKPGQTDDWSVADYAKEFSRFIGTGTVDYVLYNTAAPTPEMLEQYAHDGEFPVRIDESFEGLDSVFTGEDMLSVHTEPASANDKLALERTLIRHDPDALAQALMHIYIR